jgi:hypothetical protein
MKCPLALSLRVTPIPSRTTPKSTRPRASDRPMGCQPGNRHGLPASEIDRRPHYSIRCTRWKHATRPNTSSHAQGLKGKEIPSPSSRGRKMSLTSPLIDQAIAQLCVFCSPTSGSVSAMAILRQMAQELPLDRGALTGVQSFESKLRIAESAAFMNAATLLSISSYRTSASTTRQPECW